MSSRIQVYGHEWAQQLLQRAMQQGAVRHAYLFLGPEHIGKTTLARAFAQALTCENPTFDEGLGACGQCRSCRLAAESVHPDHRFVAPAPGKQLLIDQIREVVREAARSPIESRYKVFIISEFERANANAANALLKTLEEPSATTRIILVSHQPSGLLDTIISRCQLLRLRPLPEKQVVALLQQQAGVAAPDDALRLARLSSGRPGVALALAHDPTAWQSYQQRVQTMLSLLSASIAQRLEAATALEKDAHLETILQEWLLWWRDVLILQNQADALLVNQEQRAQLERLAAQIDPSQVRRFIEALMKTAEILRKNVNRQLAIEALLLKMPVAG